MKQHSITNQKMLVKQQFGNVCSCYVLDDDEKKIPELDNKGRQKFNINGTPTYKVAVVIQKHLL